MIRGDRLPGAGASHPREQAQSDARGRAIAESWLGEFGTYARLHVQGSKLLVGGVRGWRTEGLISESVTHRALPDGLTAVEVTIGDVRVELRVGEGCQHEFIIPLRSLNIGGPEPVVHEAPDGSRVERGETIDGRRCEYSGQHRLLARRACRPAKASRERIAVPAHTGPSTRARGAGRPRGARRRSSRAGPGGDDPGGDSAGPGERPRHLDLLAGRDRLLADSLARIEAIR